MKRYNAWLWSLAILISVSVGSAYGEESKSRKERVDPATSSKEEPADSTMGKAAGTGTPKEADKPKDKQVDLSGGQTTPEEYSTTPVRQGRLQDVSDSPWIGKPAQNAKGETLGTVKKVLKDAKTEKIEYVILAIANSKDQRPVAWSKFQEQGDRLTLNVTREQLMGRPDPRDLSPDISQYMEGIEKTRAEPKKETTKKDRKAGKKDSIALQPEAGGVHGEDTTSAGGGQAGPKSLPPGDAPSFKHEGDKGKQ